MEYPHQFRAAAQAVTRRILCGIWSGDLLASGFRAASNLPVYRLAAVCAGVKVVYPWVARCSSALLSSGVAVLHHSGTTLFRRLAEWQVTRSGIKDARGDLTARMFQSMNYQPYVPDTDRPLVPHSRAAAARTAVVGVFEALAAFRGARVYDYQMSARSDVRGLPGTRIQFWPADLKVSARRDPVPAGAVIQMIDVVNYLDPAVIFEFLAGGHVVCIYTTSPATAAGQTEDAAWTWTDENQLLTTVSGGADFREEVWDWSAEYLVGNGWSKPADSWFTAYRPHWVTARVYTRQASLTHRMVVIIPQVRVVGWSALCAWWYMVTDAGTAEVPGGKRTHFARLRPVQDGFATMRNHGGNGEISIARTLAFTSVEMCFPLYDALVSRKATATARMTTPITKSIMERYYNADDEDLTGMAAIVADYLNVVTPKRTAGWHRPQEVVSVRLGVRTTHAFHGTVDTEGPAAKLIAFASPLHHASYAPAGDGAALAHGVHRRLTTFRETSGCQRAANMQRLLPYMAEFIEMVATACDMNELHPDPIEEAIADLRTVNARRAFEAEALADMDARDPITEDDVGVFAKVEGSKMTEARPIANTSQTDKVHYSQFVAPMERKVKAAQLAWYAFSRHPRDVAARVAEICEGEEAVYEADGSRFDGHVSELARTFELMFLLRVYAREHHAHATRVHDRTYQRMCRTTWGYVFAVLFERLSGERATSFFNTMENAFIDFLSKRLAGYDEEEAFDLLGIYGGDDSLIRRTDSVGIVAAAAMCGHEYKVVTHKRGATGVMFLARYFGPDVWTGDPNSMCDLLRALGKLHTSANMTDVTALQKMDMKLESYALTDLHTPVFNALIARWRELDDGAEAAAEEDARTGRLRSWWARSYALEEGEQTIWPNEVSDWADGVADELSIDRDILTTALAACTCRADMLALPLIVDVPTTAVAGLLEREGELEPEAAPPPPKSLSRGDRRRATRAAQLARADVHRVADAATVSAGGSPAAAAAVAAELVAERGTLHEQAAARVNATKGWRKARGGGRRDERQPRGVTPKH